MNRSDFTGGGTRSIAPSRHRGAPYLRRALNLGVALLASGFCAPAAAVGQSAADLNSRAATLAQVCPSIDAAERASPQIAKDPTQEKVDAAIAKGMRWLIKAQEVDGSWKGVHPRQYRTGMTGLAVYALIKSGLPHDHRVIKKGVAFLNANTCTLTYEVGTNLLAYASLPAELRPRKRIRALTELLIEGLSEKGWKYNRPEGDHHDLSNGQYAVLGLRAAASMGERIPARMWRRAAKFLMRFQGDYGGWGYGVDDKWTDGAMTAAGTFCLAVCHEQLAALGAERGVRGELRVRIKRGMRWFERNWSVKENTMVAPTTQAPRNRWIYHYLYGLERVAALTKSDLIGGHPWYTDGAAHILKEQRDDGSWAGEDDVNTSLALLFLTRGTRTTAAPKKRHIPVAEAASETLIIRTDGKNPAIAWIRSLEKKVKERIENGQQVSTLSWELNGRSIAQVRIEGAFNVVDEKTYLRHQFEKNGDHELRARLFFANEDGSNAGEEASAPVKIWVDDVMEPSDTESIEDHGRNRVQAVEVLARSSSHLGDHEKAIEAADGLHTTSWVCANDDKKPWIELRLRPGVPARTLKLVGAHPYAGDEESWGRPKDIVVVINGSRRISATLPDDVKRKHSVALPRVRIKQLRIEITSLYPGKHDKLRVGLKEIELHP